MFDDASCTTPSSTPAIDVTSLPVGLVASNACAPSPPSLLASGFPYYTSGCRNSSDGAVYNLYLHTNQSQHGSSAFLWSVRGFDTANGANGHSAGSRVLSFPTVLIQRLSTTVFIKYSTWTCAVVGSNGAAASRSHHLLSVALMLSLWLLLKSLS